MVNTTRKREYKKSETNSEEDPGDGRTDLETKNSEINDEIEIDAESKKLAVENSNNKVRGGLRSPVKKLLKTVSEEIKRDQQEANKLPSDKRKEEEHNKSTDLDYEDGVVYCILTVFLI